MNCIRCKKELPENSLFCNFCGKRQSCAVHKPASKTRRPNNTGSISKLTGKRARPWRVEYKKKLVGTYATQSEALAALEHHRLLAPDSDKSAFTLEQVYTSFCTSERYKKLTDGGQEGLAIAWKRLSDLKAKRAKDIKLTEYQCVIDAAMKERKYKLHSPQEIAAMTDAEKERYAAFAAQPIEPLGYDGKNRIKQLVSHLYNEMIRLEITERNLADLLVLPKQSTSEKRNFTEAEKAALRANADKETVKIILIYLESGLRLGELLNLEKSAIDLQARTLQGGSKTTAGRNRIIPLTESAMPHIEYFYHKSKKYLIEENGHRLRSDTFRSARFYPTLQSLGIQYQNENGKNVLTPHRARHTFIADAVKSGVAPEALTKVAGHAKYTTTVEKYANNLDVDFLREEMEKIK